MTHVKFNRKPFEGNLNNFVDDLFTELPGLLKTEINNSGWGGRVPVNIQENEKGYSLQVIAPGFEKTDFKINLEKDVLTISAERNPEVKNEKSRQVRREYTIQSFKRSFTIDDKIDATNIDAGYVNGVLTLNLPRKEQVKGEAQEIKIK